MGRQLVTRRRTVSSLCSVNVAEEARTIAERNRPSTRAAGTRAQGGWEPARRTDVRTSCQQSPCLQQRLRPSPEGWQEDRTLFPPQTVSLQRQNNEKKASNTPVPTHKVLGPTEPRTRRVPDGAPRQAASARQAPLRSQSAWIPPGGPPGPLPRPAHPGRKVPAPPQIQVLCAHGPSASNSGTQLPASPRGPGPGTELTSTGEGGGGMPPCP